MPVRMHCYGVEHNIAHLSKVIIIYLNHLLKLSGYSCKMVYVWCVCFKLASKIILLSGKVKQNRIFELNLIGLFVCEVSVALFGMSGSIIHKIEIGVGGIAIQI